MCLVCRLASMAVLHHKRYQLRRCFNVWSRWCREEASRREMACKAELRKEKMSSLLQAVRRKGEKQPRPQQPAPPIPPSNTQQQPSSPDLSLITSKIVRQELVSCVDYFANVCYVVWSAGELCTYSGSCMYPFVHMQTYTPTHDNSISCTVQ